MKKVGLIGGMSWESSALYYRLINEQIRERLGGLHSAACVMTSVDFAEIELLIGPIDAEVPVFASTSLHATAAVGAALAAEG